MNPNYTRTIDDIEAMRYDWQESLGLEWMDITHRYLETFNDADHLTVADTEAMWEYRVATVRFFLPSVVRLERDDLEATLIHEYTHILLAPIESKLAEKHTELKEFTIEGITKALRRLRNG